MITQMHCHLFMVHSVYYSQYIRELHRPNCGIVA